MAFNIQEDIQAVSSPEATIRNLQEGMVKKFGGSTLKEHMRVLQENLKQLEENLLLLNSLSSVDDLNSYSFGIALTQPESEEHSIELSAYSEQLALCRPGEDAAKAEIKKEIHSLELKLCHYKLSQSTREFHSLLNAFNDVSQHVLNDLYGNQEFKGLVTYATKILGSLLLSPHIFDPKMQELLQPVVDFLYRFNKADDTIPGILKAFEKIQSVSNRKDKGESMPEGKGACELMWNTKREGIADLANKGGFLTVTTQVKNILNELAMQKILSQVDNATSAKIIKQCEQLKEIVRYSTGKGFRTPYEKYCDELIDKYLSRIETTYCAAFFILKLLNLKIENNGNGTKKLSAEFSIKRIDDCIEALMKEYFYSSTAYYTAKLNSNDKSLVAISADVDSKIEIMNKKNGVLIAENTHIPQTYRDMLGKHTDNGIVDLKGFFLDLFPDYSKGGIFLLAHPMRHHRGRVEGVRAMVEKITKDGKELLDWNGVLAALEKWPDGNQVVPLGSLKKRIEFFKMVMAQVDKVVQPEASTRFGCSK